MKTRKADRRLTEEHRKRMNIQTDMHTVQDSDEYLDVDCYANYEDDPRVWKRRVWLDKEANKIVTGGVTEFSGSAVHAFEETNTVPPDIEDALAGRIDAAIKEIIMPHIRGRLEYLRGELEAERISYEELAELQSLVEYIEPDDVQLLEAAGVPECREITRVTPLLEVCKELYRERGYTTEKDFSNEYYFMYNPQTGGRVRLYYNGKAWEYR